MSKLGEYTKEFVDRIKQDGLIGFTLVVQHPRTDEEPKHHLYPVYSNLGYEEDWVELREYYDLAHEVDDLKAKKATLKADIQRMTKEQKELEKALDVIKRSIGAK